MLLCAHTTHTLLKQLPAKRAPAACCSVRSAPPMYCSKSCLLCAHRLPALPATMSMGGTWPVERQAFAAYANRGFAALPSRYAWFAPHTEDFAWIGPTASLLEPGSSPARLSTLGKVYAASQNTTLANTTSAIVEDQLAISTASLSANDVQALTEPLSAVQKTGSWLAACVDCLDDTLSALVLTQHCQDCGLLLRAAAAEGVAGGRS